MFNATFFETDLGHLVAEYAQHREIMNADDLRMSVGLTTGASYRITGRRVAENWVVLVTENDHVVLVPYELISSVEVEHHFGAGKTKLPPGFRGLTESAEPTD